MQHGRILAAAIGVALSWIAGVTAAQAQYGRNFGEPNIIGGQVMVYGLAGLLGLIIGALFSDKFKQYRKYFWMALGVLIILVSLGAPFPANSIITAPVAIVIFFVALGFGLAWGRLAGGEAGTSSTFGSAKWATANLLQEKALVGDQGLALGYFPERDRLLPLHYTGDRHLLTVAPTRAGKGVSAIIPNLLTYRGSALVIDPKGENAMITALRRGKGDKGRGIEGMGQEVHVLDPWGLATDVIGIQAACFNPLEWIDPASPEAGENAMMLADALVVPASGGDENPFWAEESKALLMGLILYVVTDPAEEGRRNLGRVRDLLMQPAAELTAMWIKMASSSHLIIASTGARTAGKDAKLLSNVLAAVQSHTHMLDSPRLRESLSRSSFRFEDLKREPTTIYLVLPADRLNTFGRWLRLMIQQAITVTARNIEDKPQRPILFLLDEMAALGRLSMVEQAYGLMAGFGMQLWGIVQDLSQLERIYGKGWQTFVGNSGVLQYFGSRDKMTAEYFSDLCGVTTVPTITSAISQAISGSGGSTSQNFGETSRKLILPDELMRVDRTVQIVLVENLDPIAGRKIEWFTDGRFKPHGINLRSIPTASRPVSPLAPEKGPEAE